MSGLKFVSLIRQSYFEWLSLFCLWGAKKESESCYIVRPKAPDHQLCSGARGRTIFNTQFWTDFLVSLSLLSKLYLIYVCLDLFRE